MHTDIMTRTYVGDTHTRKHTRENLFFSKRSSSYDAPAIRCPCDRAGFVFFFFATVTSSAPPSPCCTRLLGFFGFAASLGGGARYEASDWRPENDFFHALYLLEQSHSALRIWSAWRK